MFLYVEMPVGVQAADRQQVGKEDADGVGNKLRNKRNDVNAGVAKPKKLIHAGTEENKDLGWVASASHLPVHVDGTAPAPASTNWQAGTSSSRETHDAEEPGPKGVDRHFRVIRLGDNSADGWEGARFGVPVSFDIILSDDPRQIDLKLDEMAIDNVCYRTIVGIVSLLPGEGFDILRQRLVALASCFFGVHRSFSRGTRAPSCQLAMVQLGVGKG